MPTVDPPSRPRNAIVFISRVFASCRARATFLDLPEVVRHEHIARDTKRGNLTRKDLVETIPSGGENSAIARETNRRKRASTFSKTNNEFCHKCEASVALPPFPDTSNLFPARKH